MNTLVQVFVSWRMLLVLFMGFSSGMPLMLTASGSTMQGWLSDAKLDLATIGRFALVGLPYTFKFLWAPLLDSTLPPILGRWGWGRRRGWALLIQVGLILSTVGLAFSDPGTELVRCTLMAMAVAFFSASQDIVLDAFRIEILEEKEYGAGAGVYIMGYRLATLVSGAVALGMAQSLPWKTVYLVMAALMTVGIAAVLLAPEPKYEPREIKSLKDRVLLPFIEFLRRPAAMEILLFVMTYKLSTMMATALTTTFLMSLGFTKVEIAAVSKVFGLIATIVGTLAGGALMTKLGTLRSLWIFGVLQALAGLTFLMLNEAGANRPAMIFAVVTENFMIGLGVAAISGFMMSISSKQFTGSQFALLTSLTSVSRVVLVSQAGVLAEWLGWSSFFFFSVFLAIPGLLLLRRYGAWTESLDSHRELTQARIAPYDLFVIAIFLVSLVCISSDPLWGYFGMPWAGSLVARIGAGGVVLTILAGLLKPRFSGRARAKGSRG